MTQATSPRGLAFAPDEPPPVALGARAPRAGSPQKITPRPVIPAARFSPAPDEAPVASSAAPAMASVDAIPARKAASSAGAPSPASVSASSAASGRALGQPCAPEPARPRKSGAAKAAPAPVPALAMAPATNANPQAAIHAPTSAKAESQGPSAAGFDPRAQAAFDAWKKAGASWEDIQEGARLHREKRAEGHLGAGVAAIRNAGVFAAIWTVLFLAFGAWVGLYAQLRGNGQFSVAQIGLHDSPTTLLWCVLLGGFMQGAALALREDAGPRKWLPTAAVWASMGPTWLAAEAIRRAAAGQDAIGWQVAFFACSAALLMAWRAVSAGRPSAQARMGLRGKKGTTSKFLGGPAWLAFCVAFGVSIALIEAPAPRAPAAAPAPAAMPAAPQAPAARAESPREAKSAAPARS